MATCANSGKEFTVSDADHVCLAELSPVINGKTYSLPDPTQCPDAREQRRLAMANLLNLYERKCDLTGSSILSNFHSSSSYKVYRLEDWYSDAWDPLEYGRDYDFERSFFDQYAELMLDVPFPALHKGFEYDENADYTNYAGKNKNCYLIFDSDENRDCYYSYSAERSESCMDSYRIRDCELCCECIDSVHCYNSAYLQDCDNCSDSVFLKNCIGCRHCLMCSNLQNKEYCVENKQVSKTEYESFRKLLGSYTTLQQAKERFETLKLEYPQKYMHGVQNENVVGDYLTNCKNAYNCFDCHDLWDCRHCFQSFMGLKNCMDTQECGDAERCYESAFSGYSTQNMYFSVHCLGEVNDVFYCMHCKHSSDLFGCIGLRHKQYCIFNKQYTREEYFALVPKIIEQMQKAKEWGEFFPVRLSTFAYNETIAQDHFPMMKEEVLAKGWKWFDEVEKMDQYMGPKAEVPDSIDDVDESICKQILTCDDSSKQYKIIPQELKLYKQMHLPLPRKRFLTRHKDRLRLRNTRALHTRSCTKCSVDFETTYGEGRPKKIYCDKCYLDSLQ